MKKKRKTIIIIIAVVLAAAYLAGAEFTLNAALVPEFMSRLDAFEKATEKGYSVQVQSDDIDANSEKSLSATEEWYKNVEKQKYYTLADDGIKLIATFFEQDPDAPWVFVLHGYTGWKEEMYPYAMHFHQQGYNVVVPDLRAQGESEGKFIGLGWTDKDDLKVWMNAIIKKNPDARFIIYGLSMGASTTLIMSGEKDIEDRLICTIADAAFTDGLSMFKGKVHDWLGIPTFGLVDTAGFLLRFHKGGYDIRQASALKSVQKSTVPTLFITGTEDRIVDSSNTMTLYEKCSAEKELLVIEGAGHGQCIDKDPETYFDTIFAFIEKQED